MKPDKATHCPACNRVLYNRRLPRCGFCGATIPAKLRFTPEKIAALDREMAALEAGRKERQLAEKAAQAAAEAQVPIIFPIIFP